MAQRRRAHSGMPADACGNALLLGASHTKKEARHANVFHLFLFLCEKQQGLFGCGFVVSLFNNTSFLARECAEIIQFRTTNFTTLVHFN